MCDVFIVMSALGSVLTKYRLCTNPLIPLIRCTKRKQTYFKIHHMKISIHRLVLIIILLHSNSFADTVTEPLRIFTGHTDIICVDDCLAFSPDGQFILSGSWDDTLKLWSVSTGEEIRTFTGHSDSVRSVAFSPDGQFALSGSWDKTLKLWSVSTGDEIRTFTGHSNDVY